MTFSARPQNHAAKIFVENNWVADTYVSVLVDAAHTHSDGDTLYSDISANVVSGTVLEVESRSLVSSAENTYLQCNNFTYVSSHSAKYKYILRRDGGSLVTSDFLVGKIDLNDGQTGNITVSGNLIVNSNGLFLLRVSSSQA